LEHLSYSLFYESVERGKNSYSTFWKIENGWTSIISQDYVTSCRWRGLLEPLYVNDIVCTLSCPMFMQTNVESLICELIKGDQMNYNSNTNCCECVNMGNQTVIIGFWLTKVEYAKNKANYGHMSEHKKLSANNIEAGTLMIELVVSIISWWKTCIGMKSSHEGSKDSSLWCNKMFV